MAIKGKKKSQNRGSQARRRPAQAPRPVLGKSMKPPWYRTTAGQSIAAISTLILLVIVLVLVNNARDAAAEKEQAQESLENYTDQVDALLQRIMQPASALSAASTAPPEDPKELKDQAEEWRDTFTAAQSEVTQFIAPPEASTSRDLFLESLRLWATAADTMAIAVDLEDSERVRLLTTATGQVTTGSSIWDAAVGVLDDARDEADLDASGLHSPTMASSGGVQTPGETTTVPVEPPDDGSTSGGSGSGGGKGGKGKKGDGGDG